MLCRVYCWVFDFGFRFAGWAFVFGMLCVELLLRGFEVLV